MSRLRKPILIVTWFVLICVNLSPVAAQPAPYRDTPEIPATPAYARAQELLALINAGDAEKIRDYVREAFSPEFLNLADVEDHVAILQGLGEGDQPLELHSARLYDPPRPATDAVLILRHPMTEAWQGLVVTVEEAAPFRITGAQCVPARRPSDLPAVERLDDAAIVRELGAYVERMAERGAFSGTLLLARDGRLLLTKAAGLANRDFAVPVDLDTKFNLGSMNKMFTAVAIAQLAEQGRLALDQPIAAYLDTTWLASEILERVTIHHLLTHTSGLGSYFNEVFDRSSRLLFREVEDYKPLVRGERLRFDPGTDWAYSNTGFLLLGAIVERASGQNYFAYVREHITLPAGMTDTDCYELDRVNENLAVGYERSAGGEHRNNIFDHVLRGGPAGGGYSTVTDLLRFDTALRAGRLVGPQMRERLLRAYPERNSPQYGYGFGVQDTPAGRLVGHGGGFTGISSQLGMYLDAGYTIVVLSNDGRGAPPLYEQARQLIEQGR